MYRKINTLQMLGAGPSMTEVRFSALVVCGDYGLERPSFSAFT